MRATDIVGCVGSATFVLMASLWIPFVGPFISLLTPLPFLYYATRLGLPQGLKLAALTMIAVGLLCQLTGHTQGILFAIQFILAGLFLSVLLRRGMSIGQTVVLATGFLLVLSMGFLAYAAVRRGMGPWDLVHAYLGENLREGFRAYEQMAVSPDHGTAFRQYVDALIHFLLRIFPALMVVGTGFAVWLNVVLALRLFRAAGLDLPEHLRLDLWRAPEHLVWVLLASGFALFLTSGSIQFIAINTWIVVMAVYVFHGLSIVVFFLGKYRVPPWVRIGTYVLIVVQQLFMVVLALAGLFDQWVDFRRIRRQQGTELGEGGD